MFYKSAEYDLNVESQYVDKITCLTSSGSRIFIGREDGYLESIDQNHKWKIPVFKKEYDFLENDIVKEQIIAIEHLTDGGICDTFFLANEKSISVLKTRNKQSAIEISRTNFSKDIRIMDTKKCLNVHSYIINSLTLNLSKTILLSSDFLKINMWSPEHMDKYYNIIDLKPGTGQEDNISCVINTTKFSPFSENIMAWASSNGKVNIHDMGITPKSQCVTTIDSIHHNNVKSISDISFINSNQFISRSINNVFLTDLRKPDKPVFSRDLIVNQQQLTLMDSSNAMYLTFKITNNNQFAYTGSCFESVYLIDLANGNLEEIIVGIKNNLNIDKRIKYVIFENSGFVCAFGGKICHYKKTVE